MSGQNKKMENDREHDTFKRFDYVPPMKVNNDPKKVHVMDDFDKKQNSTNSNSPISVTSLDEIFESVDPTIGNLHQKTSFYSAHQNFSDDKSSGASSLFSSGM